jgi:gluconolactonase
MKLRIAAALCGSALLLSFAAQAQNYSTASLPAPKGGVSAVQGASIRRADPALDKLIAPNARIEKLASGFQFTEGPMWHKGELWFSDLRANKIYSVSPQGKLTLRLDRAGGVDSFDSRYYRGSNGIVPSPDGGLLVAQHSGHRIIKVDDKMQVTSFLDKFEGKPLSSPNDMVYARDGGLYFSDPPYFYADPVSGKVDPDKAPGKVQATNNVYHYKNGKLTAVIRDLPRPNGIALSPDGKTMYVANTENPKALWRYDVRPDGTVTNKRLFANWNSDSRVGLPDGVKVDIAGNVYASGPGGIRILSPQGKELGQINLPEDAANLAFGGADQKTLYITASTGIYRVNLNVAGMKPMYSR